MPTFVFLDTQAYEAASFNMQSRHLRTLAKHLESGRLQLVTTDITRTEVHRRLDCVCKKELASLKKLKRTSRVLYSAHMIQELGLFCDTNLDGTQMSLHRAADRFLDDHNTTVIEAMAQDARPVFARYFATEPPFAPGPKRKEFPDAFVVDALLDWIQPRSGELLVVSGDGPFREACDRSGRIETFEKLIALLDKVASDDEVLADSLRDEILGQIGEIQDFAKQEFENLGFYLEDEWGDVELEITDIELYDGPDLIDVCETQVGAELRLEVQYSARLSYDDSSTGTYDKEEGRRVFMDHVNETITSSAQLSVAVTATFSGRNIDGFTVQRMELTEPAGMFGIPTSKMDDR